MRVPATRVAAIIAVVAGIAIAIVPFAFSLAGNANGGERITDRFRFTFTDEGLHQLTGGYQTAVGMGSQFFTQTLPGVQRELHVSPAAFRADLRTHYPAIVTAEKQVPPVVAIVTPRVPALLSARSDFHKVDSLPFLGLPISYIPWLLLAIGVIVAGLGAVVLARPTRLGAALIAAAGLALIVVPLAVNAFDKSDSAVKLDKVGSFVFAPKITAAASGTTDRLNRMVNEVNKKFIPRTAGQLHESPARFKAQVAARYPAVARGLAAWPVIGPRAIKQSHDQVASVKDFADLHGLHFKALPWTVIGPGILLLLVGLVAVLLPARRPA